MQTLSEPILTVVRPAGLAKFKSGKVRELFDLGHAYLLVATDRISAFDCVLPSGIPGKGRVLNQLSSWWFDRTRAIVPNHLITAAFADFPAELQPFRSELAGRSMLVRKAAVLPIECVIRGYLIGSGWKEYEQTGIVSGIKLRRGYRLADRLDQPLFTPARKAETGHDENISFTQMADAIGQGMAGRLRDLSLALYQQAFDYALTRGILIADTKFEFGLVNGEPILIDEALTPDSSRFWSATSYRPGISPPSFDKQFVRDYLESISWNKQPPAPVLPEDVVIKTRDKYREAFARLTGKELET